MTATRDTTPMWPNAGLRDVEHFREELVRLTIAALPIAHARLDGIPGVSRNRIADAAVEIAVAASGQISMVIDEAEEESAE